MSRIKNRLGSRTVRLTRSWRGYPAGALLAPPAGLRQVLLQKQLAREITEATPRADLVADIAAPEADAGPSSSPPLVDGGDAPAIATTHTGADSVGDAKARRRKK